MTMPSKSDENAFALCKIELYSEVDDQMLPVTAIIRQPFECRDASWLCAANISGLFHRKADLERSSAIDSIKAARAFVLEELSGFVAGGGRLCTKNKKPLTDLRQVFPKDLLRT